MIRFIQQWWGILGLGLIVVVIFTLSRVQQTKFSQERRYTAAEVYGSHWTPKAGKYADARFMVNGQTYTVSANADRLAGRELVGQRFLVKFHPPEPQRYQVLYLDAPVPGDVTDVPADGWETPPFPVPAEVLK